MPLSEGLDPVLLCNLPVKVTDHIKNLGTIDPKQSGGINSIKWCSCQGFCISFFFKYLKKNKTKIDSITMPVIWRYKTHCIGEKHLCKPKDLGGLALLIF